MLLKVADTDIEVPRWNILVLCTGNSARSILAEALFSHCSAGWFRCFSAGSQPTGKVNPFALRELVAQGIEPAGYRSKSWQEFTGGGAPQLDVLLTVCDSAAAEVCPAFAGDYTHVHWGLPDPAAVPDDEKPAAFAHCFETLKQRFDALLQLPLAEYTRQDLAQAMRQMAGADVPALAPEGLD
ncbi:arsenate reductase [Microbulbifer donghaiensis]|uniref:Arsenate reductase n=1 Tax=Microbulbifer donghaiensis TaxID=494016 RepID=A0A1M4UY06_9GAMM|nr:arsenate reductase ArsC [Microbulbifer donghaiensis]SHE61606.1 arsenate reductase [Microbulbifer donghaiensis]